MPTSPSASAFLSVRLPEATRERLEDIRAAAEDALAFAGELDEAAFAPLPVADRRTYRARLPWAAFGVDS